tara:strand:+ start:1359 stop:1931 length:573 start_codon:yes stop_codon:yes gene_type:complete
MTNKLFGLFKSLTTNEEEEASGKSAEGEGSRRPRTQVTEEMVDYAKTQLEAILKAATYTGYVEPKHATYQISLEIKDSDDSGRLIGKDGSHISALQTIIRAMLFQKFGESPRVIIDNKNYQVKRINTIRNKALKAIEKLNGNRTRLELDPMSPTERREIHMMLKKRPDINCYSEGDGENRHIILEKVDVE